MEAEEIIGQIRQIKEKYESQVTGEHKQWPRAIKERVVELYRSGVKLKVISEGCGISYHTVASWTAKVSKSKFKEVSVHKNLGNLPVLSSIRRPVGRRRTRIQNDRNGTVTMRTPEGLVVEGLSVLDLVQLLKQLGAK